MLYFDNLPIVDYGSDKIRDIFKNVVITNFPADDWYDVYQLNENQTLYSVSLELYDTVDYWWLLAIINNISDVHYDTFINSDIIQELAKDTQVLEFTNGLSDYLIFPQDTSITYLIPTSVTTFALNPDGSPMLNPHGSPTENPPSFIYTEVSGEVIRKYISEGKYLLDVRLDDSSITFPSTFTATLSSNRLESVVVNTPLTRNSIYRQDFVDDNGYKFDFARGYCVETLNDGGKLFKINDNPFRVTGSTFSSGTKTLTASTLLKMDYETTSTSHTISSSAIINTFNLQSPEEYENLYLDRYDEIEEINNRKRIIKTFKKEHKDLIINQFLNKFK